MTDATLPESTNSPAASLTSEPEKLLPCPFCGGEARWVEDTGALDTPFGLVTDHTPTCFLSGRMMGEWSDIITAWNTRLSSPVSGTDMVERLAQAMWASEDEPGTLDESGRRGTFERLAHAAISASPTPPIPMIAEAGERGANPEMLALVRRVWARYDKDDEPEDGWSEADQDVMSLLGWNHTLFSLSHPSKEDVEARDLIRRSAALVKPEPGETVFYIRVGGEHSHLTVNAAKNVKPADALCAAIAALRAEQGDLSDCPVHTALSTPATLDNTAVEAERLRTALQTIADLRIANDFGFYAGPSVAEFARAALTAKTEKAE